jgi:hypothetical protein
MKWTTSAERYAEGKSLRKGCPRESHAAWKAPANRRDAVETVLAAEKGRVPELLPLRHGRMVQSPFTLRTSSPPSSTPRGTPPGEIQDVVRETMAGYRETLPVAYRALLDRYELRDAAIKVVGIGSVGTSCWVLLLMAGEGDPLFLQVKEARSSVLEPFAGKTEFGNHGQRVVDGYRRMQPASDMFLRWTRGKTRDFFVRQLRDVKISIRVETFGLPEMELYASWCGRALALAHARSGMASGIAGYLGRSDVFDEAMVAFSMAYADQNEKDHAALDRAVRKGRVKAAFEEDR